MVSYAYKGDSFVVKDYLNAKAFASFLPSIAGVDGIPLWGFFVNRGQGMASFGTNSKETPIVPFESMLRVLEDIRLKGFRTFVKDARGLEKPFFSPSNHSAQLTSELTGFELTEKEKGFDISVSYYTVSHQDFPGLIRKVTYTSKLPGRNDFAILDGLPRILPYGLSSGAFDKGSSLGSAYTEIEGLEANMPFVKNKTSMADTAEVSLSATGNAYVVIDEKGRRLKAITDPRAVFGADASFAAPLAFGGSEDYPSGISQRTENYYPAAFAYAKTTLAQGESYTTYALFTTIGSYAKWEDLVANRLTPEFLDGQEKLTREMADRLVATGAVHTGNRRFDMYVKQSFFDNYLRGGFPMLLAPGRPYYVFGRKHGDLERDYNDFYIPAEYYSSGNANFRDINQNRRNDLIYFPFIGDYNIRIFYDLIQLDGQNPLNVKQATFSLTKAQIKAALAPFGGLTAKPQLAALLASFRPGQLFRALIEDIGRKKAQQLFVTLMGKATPHVEAAFAEGYWTDHWTYNQDLVENYLAVFPDRRHELLFASGYRYFHTPVYVEPRSARYVINSAGQVRQYNSIDQSRLKTLGAAGISGDKTDWLRDKDGTVIETTLASKMLNLVLIKFATLDSFQEGLEMEGGKPGWNDAMNGMPGLFGSSLCETVELLRVVDFLKAAFVQEDPAAELVVLAEQAALYQAVRDNVVRLAARQESGFAFWDLLNSAKEQLRLAGRDSVTGRTVALNMGSCASLLDQMAVILRQGITRAKALGNGILPTYIINEPVAWQKTGRVNGQGYETVKVTAFAQKPLPPFLEATARLFKLADGSATAADYDNIKASGLYDSTLGIYKTATDVERAPFEIGRIHAFTRGWLERECDFLHMTYKYLLGLLRGGLYRQFYEAAKTNLVCNMEPGVYGRSVTENSSFIIPTCNPDASIHGRGYFARLTGANAELLNIVDLLFIGAHPFSMTADRKLAFTPRPLLAKELFDAKGEASFLLFGKTKIVYKNPRLVDTYASDIRLHFIVDGRPYEQITGGLAHDIRDGRIGRVDAIIA